MLWVSQLQVITLLIMTKFGTGNPVLARASEPLCVPKSILDK